MMQVTRQALVQLRSFCPVVESTGVAAQRCYHKNVSGYIIICELLIGSGGRSSCVCKRVQGRECARQGHQEYLHGSVDQKDDSCILSQVVDHYEKPRNVGSFDKKDIDVGTGLVGAPACGDVMKLQIRVRPSSSIGLSLRDCVTWLTLLLT